MSQWLVRGGNRLEGSLAVQGAKNAVLPILAATILTGCETELLNCPELLDVTAAMDILRYLGCEVQRQDDAVLVDSRGLTGCALGAEHTGRMRSSVIFLGAILARCGEARLSLPGGCELGPRPIDLHLEAMEALGASVERRGNEVLCRAPKLKGAVIRLNLPSVGATENAMIAACGAEGETVITNAAREPEIQDLQSFLRAMGADMHGAGGPVITVRGFAPRKRVGHRVMPDRICAATLLCACGCAGGDIELRGVEPGHFQTVTDGLAAMGCVVRQTRHHIRLRCDGPLQGGSTFITRPYPGFPTDAQPLMMAASLKAAGTTVFVRTFLKAGIARRRRCFALARIYGPRAGLPWSRA